MFRRDLLLFFIGVTTLGVYLLDFVRDFNLSIQQKQRYQEDSSYGEQQQENQQLKRNDDQNGLIIDDRDELDGNNVVILKVVAFPYLRRSVKHVHARHLIEDGIEQSSHLRFSKNVSDFSPNTVWLVDSQALYDEFGKGLWCANFTRSVKEAIKKRRNLNLPVRWPIHVINQRDRPDVFRCPAIEELVGGEYVTYSQRGVIISRGYDREKDWVRQGEVHRTLGPWKRGFARPAFQHTPITVRTDMVREVQQELRTEERYGNKTLVDSIERDWERVIDVSYFWDPKREDAVKLRNRVYKILRRYARSKKDRYDFRLGLVGGAGREGRVHAGNAYVQAMLDSKIIVLAQRDSWEDQYRLFEAVVAGAMIMTDRMLSPPAGLLEEEGMVQYDSAQDLLDKIEYYLQHDEERMKIAASGRRVAMTRHRSWHRMEEVFFRGTIQSNCDPRPHRQGGSLALSTSSRDPCPFVVHANESKSLAKEF